MLHFIDVKLPPKSLLVNIIILNTNPSSLMFKSTTLQPLLFQINVNTLTL